MIFIYNILESLRPYFPKIGKWLIIGISIFLAVTIVYIAWPRKSDAPEEKEILDLKLGTDYVLMIDRSESLGKKDSLDKTLSLANALIDLALPPDRIGIISYSTEAHIYDTLRYVGERKSENRDTLKQTIQLIASKKPGGFTNTIDALNKALKIMDEKHKDKYGFYNVMLILLTTGEIVPPYKAVDVEHAMDGVIQKTMKEGWPVYIGGISQGGKLHKTLVSLAVSTGGGYKIGERSEDVLEIFKNLILTSQKHSYTKLVIPKPSIYEETIILPDSLKKARIFIASPNVTDIFYKEKGSKEKKKIDDYLKISYKGEKFPLLNLNKLGLANEYANGQQFNLIIYNPSQIFQQLMNTVKYANLIYAFCLILLFIAILLWLKSWPIPVYGIIQVPEHTDKYIILTRQSHKLGIDQGFLVKYKWFKSMEYFGKVQIKDDQCAQLIPKKKSKYTFNGNPLVTAKLEHDGDFQLEDRQYRFERTPSSPYVYNSPVDDQNFAGRKRLLAELKENYLREQPDIFLVYGEKRTGKTSILRQLKRNLADSEFHKVEIHESDVKEFERTNDSIYDFLINKILFEKLEVSKAQSPFESASKLADMSNHEIMARMRMALSSKADIGNKRIVILIDEFDIFLKNINENPTENARFLDLLKDLNKQKLFHFFLTGADIFGKGNEISEWEENRKIKKLNLLTSAETEDLIQSALQGKNTGIEFDSTAIKAIYNLAAGHPCFTQLLCDATLKKPMQIMNAKDVEHALPGAFEFGKNIFDALWKNGFEPVERCILGALAKLSFETRGAEKERWKRRLLRKLKKNEGIGLSDILGTFGKHPIDFRITDIESRLNWLIARDILSGNTRSEIRFNIKLWEYWILEHEVIDKLLERGGEI